MPPPGAMGYDPQYTKQTSKQVPGTLNNRKFESRHRGWDPKDRCENETKFKKTKERFTFMY